MTFEGDIEDLQSAVVMDRAGDKVGKVGQLYLDNETQQPSWVTVNTGLFGTHESFVPLDDAKFSEGTLTVPYEKSFIKDAPRIEEKGELPRETEDELFSYYGLGGVAAGTAGGRGRQGDGREHDGRHAGAPGQPEHQAGSPGPRDGEAGVPAGQVSQAGRDQARPGAGAGAGAEDANVTLHEERANVRTEKVTTGKARLRKHVVTDTETVEVPVQREEVVLEREPAGDRPGGTISEEDVEVTLSEERPVVEKETVATENVRLGKRAVQESETVNTELVHEEVEFDDQTPGGPRADRPGRQDGTGRPQRDR